MSTKPQTTDFILEQLDNLNVRARKMFGEYALYCDEKLPAFICDDTLFVKIIDANEKLATGLKKGPCYPGSKDYYIVPGERLDDRAWLQSFVQTTADFLPAKKNQKGFAHVLLFLLFIVVIGFTGFVGYKVLKSKPEGPGSGKVASRDCKVQFTAAPMKIDSIAAIYPLGKMGSSSGHVTPTDHQYIIPVGMTATDNHLTDPTRFPVYAPADATIISLGKLPDTINGTPVGDFRVDFKYDCDVYSAFMHVARLSPALQTAFDAKNRNGNASVAIKVKAGEQIGTKGPNNLDFLAWDNRVTLAGFVDAKDYANETWKTHVIDPLSMYSAPLKSQLTDKLMRAAEPRGGKIDYDKDGYLAGNWFLKGCDSKQPGTCDLTVAYDALSPDQVIISLANFKNQFKAFAVKGNAPDPATVGIGTEPTKYELVNYQWVNESGQEWRDFWGPGYKNITVKPTTQVVGTVMFQLTAKRELKVEVFPDKTAANTPSFTPAAKTYSR
jgi:TfoX/Sxy family transcriptional regulator of competence genes